MAIYKVTISFNNQNLGKAVNVYWFEGDTYAPGNSTFLSAVEQWMEAIYQPLRQYMDTGYQFGECGIDLVNGEGTVISHMGDVNPTVSGSGSGDSLALTTTATAVARTGSPKIRGRKSFGGILEQRQSDGLFDNALLNVLAQATLAWIIGPGVFGLPEAVAGVLSTTILDLVSFSGSGQVTNVPGTMVTRKPLRGS